MLIAADHIRPKPLTFIKIPYAAPKNKYPAITGIVLGKAYRNADCLISYPPVNHLQTISLLAFNQA